MTVMGIVEGSLGRCLMLHTIVDRSGYRSRAQIMLASNYLSKGRILRPSEVYLGANFGGTGLGQNNLIRPLGDEMD